MRTGRVDGPDGCERLRWRTAAELLVNYVWLHVVRAVLALRAPRPSPNPWCRLGARCPGGVCWAPGLPDLRGPRTVGSAQPGGDPRPTKICIIEFGPVESRVAPVVRRLCAHGLVDIVVAGGVARLAKGPKPVTWSSSSWSFGREPCTSEGQTHSAHLASYHFARSVVRPSIVNPTALATSSP